VQKQTIPKDLLEGGSGEFHRGTSKGWRQRFSGYTNKEFYEWVRKSL
jgi:hypothetical protein